MYISHSPESILCEPFGTQKTYLVTLPSTLKR